METTLNCPKCNHISTDEKFSICPKCGIIINKYYETLEAKQRLEAERLERKTKSEEDDFDWFELVIGRWGFSRWGFSVVGVVFLLAGMLFEAGEGSIVNLYRLHIKETLYTLGGVFLIIAAINSGIGNILTALADIHTTIKKQNK